MSSNPIIHFTIQSTQVNQWKAWRSFSLLLACCFRNSSLILLEMQTRTGLTPVCRKVAWHALHSLLSTSAAAASCRVVLCMVATWVLLHQARHQSHSTSTPSQLRFACLLSTCRCQIAWPKPSWAAWTCCSRGWQSQQRMHTRNNKEQSRTGRNMFISFPCQIAGIPVDPGATEIAISRFLRSCF